MSGRWFPAAWEQGSADEEEEIGVLERRKLCHSSISVASSPARPEPISGIRDQPTVEEELPAPHYIMLENSAAPQNILVEESPPAMSGVKQRPCVLLECPLEPMGDQSGTTSLVSMTGRKDERSLVDYSPALPKVNSLGAEGR